MPDDWEDREQTLFRATDFGDDIDRPLLKSDGSYTYFASDVAYSRNKIRRGYKELIYILGRRSWRLCEAAGSRGRGAGGQRARSR